MPTSLLSFLTFLSFLSSITAGRTLLNVADTLIDSGYLSMALTLRLVSNTLYLDSPTATIFVPSDLAFINSGSLPLSLLQNHILPTRLALNDLRNLPHGASIPTLLSNCSITVTTSPVSPTQLSINNVTVANTAIFDDGLVIAIAIDEFFNSSFLLLPELGSAPSPSPRNDALEGGRSGFDNESYGSVSDVLRSRGCSIMATFLEDELAEFTDGTRFTIFAPVDEAFVENVRNISDYSLIFWKHIVPIWLPWQDLLRLQAETLLPTFSEGFTVKVTVSPRVRLLNGVPVEFPDMYHSDILIVHGLNRLLV